MAGKKPQAGVGKGQRPGAPPRFGAAPKTVDRCRNCRITSLVLATTGAPSITQPQVVRKVGFVTVKENEPELTIRATTAPPECPCVWSLVGVEYVEILTGAAAKMKRRNFHFHQIIETITIDPANPRNPYASVNGCTLKIKIKDLNDDLRAGINTGKSPFAQGVVVRLGVRVKCGTTPVTLLINVADA